MKQDVLKRVTDVSDCGRLDVKLKIRNSALKKRRLSGFLKRKSTKAGRRILARRRRKGRSLTTV